jgi:hypothetical protein
MVVCTLEDKAVFDDYLSKFKDKDSLPMGELMLQTGFYFLEDPYVSHTLEVAQPEKLVVNLRQLDCTTFTESCLALARTIKAECGPSFDTYLCELERIRYRLGILEDYTSRLHYFSDWIYDNNQKSIIKDMTKELRGEPFPIRADAMTRLSKNYPQLADSSYLKKIGKIQEEISSRSYYYIPKDRVDSVDIHDGDIIAMTVSGKGLDIMHMGIAIHNKGRLYFMHASSTGKRVMISELPFKEYLANIKSNTGIMVLRPLEP